MPKIHVEWKGNMIFEGKDSDGHSLVMDASAIYGGKMCIRDSTNTMQNICKAAI